MPGANPPAIFVPIPIQNIVTAVFNAPMSAILPQHLLGAGLFAGLTGEAIGRLPRDCAGFLVHRLPLDDERLTDPRKVEIVVEFAGGPDATSFDAAMALIDGGQFRRASFPKEEFNVIQQAGLIPLNRKQIMRPASEQVFRELALREQGVGGNQATLDIEGVEQRGGDFDLVGLLELVGAGDGDFTYFFWVRQARLWWPTALIM